MVWWYTNKGNSEAVYQFIIYIAASLISVYLHGFRPDLLCDTHPKFSFNFSFKCKHDFVLTTKFYLLVCVWSGQGFVISKISIQYGFCLKCKECTCTKKKKSVLKPAYTINHFFLYQYLKKKNYVTCKD